MVDKEEFFKCAQGTILILNGKNYNKWADAIHWVFHGADLWNIVTGKELGPEEANGRKKFDLRCKSAEALLMGACTYDVRTCLKDSTTVNEMWLELKKRFDQSLTSDTRNNLCYQWDALHYMPNSGMTLDQFFNELRNLASILDGTLDEKSVTDHCRKIVNEMPEEYERELNIIMAEPTRTVAQMEMAIKSRANAILRRKAVEETKAALEMAANSKATVTNSNTDTADANYTEKQPRKHDNFCNHCRIPGHIRSNCRKLKRRFQETSGNRYGGRRDNNSSNFKRARYSSNSNTDSNTNFSGTCYNCGGRGHTKQQCSSPPQSSGPQANYAAEEDFQPSI